VTPWLLYVIDSMRETAFMTFDTVIDPSHCVVHLDPNDFQRPTTMTLQFRTPVRAWWRGGVFERHMSQGAGMWIYLKVPKVNNIEWHPFSLASAEGDSQVHLQVGIRNGVSTSKKSADNWVKEKNKQLEQTWVQKEGKTFTYQLYEILLHMQKDEVIPAKIRGPYGSSFRLCFQPNIKGALICGAGTGLSAVQSMLRAMIHRKEMRYHCPDHLWIMWHARRVGDLLWVWDDLVGLLVDAAKKGLLPKGDMWTPSSKKLGFLRITFFVSRAEKGQLETLRAMPKNPDDKYQIHEWLTSRNRILTSSISSEGTHIGKYIRHCQAELNRLEGKKSDLGISFCGPTSVSRMIADAAAAVGTHVEFSSDAT